MDKKWWELDVRFINGKKERMERLVRIFGNDSLDTIFVSQVTIPMMRPLRFHRLRRARLKKPGERIGAPRITLD